MKRLDAYSVYLLMEAGKAALFSMIFTASSIYQVSVAGLTPLQLVLVGTMLEVAVLVFEVPTGVVADVYSRRLSIIIGTVLVGCGFIMEGSIPRFAPILLAQVIWGLGYTFTSGATQAWISDEIGEAAAGQAFLRSAQIGEITALAGIGAGVLIGSQKVSLPIIAGGAMMVLLAIFLALFMPETGFVRTPQIERSTWGNMVHTFREGLKMVQRRPALLTILGVGLFYGLYSEAYDRLWTKHLVDDIGFPALAGLAPVAWLGIMRATGMLLSAGVTGFVRPRVRTEDHYAVTRLLSWITVSLIAGLLVFAIARSFVPAILAFLLIYISRSLIEPLYTAWVNQRLDANVRATVISMSGQVDAFGQIAGGPLLGLIANMFSVQTAIALSGVVLSPVLVLFRRARRMEVEPKILSDTPLND